MKDHGCSADQAKSKFDFNFSVTDTEAKIEFSRVVNFSDIKITMQEDEILFCFRAHSKDTDEQAILTGGDSEEIKDDSIEKASINELDVSVYNDKKHTGITIPISSPTEEDSHCVEIESVNHVTVCNCDAQECIDNMDLNITKQNNPQIRCESYSAFIKDKEQLIISRKDLLAEINKIKDAITEYQNRIPWLLYRDAFQKLANFYQTIVAISQNTAIPKAVLDELFTVIDSFGFDKIEPKRGDAVDLIRHIPCDSTARGEIVLSCKECGWAKGDVVIKKAVVDVEETENGDE